MDDILKDLLITIVNEAASLFDGFITNLAGTVFYAENIWKNLFIFDQISAIIYKYALVLITIKFLLKMFAIYVGWTDGDPLTNPAQMLINFIRSIAIAISFPDIYKFMVDLTTEMVDEILDAMQLVSYTMTDMVSALTLASYGLFFNASVLIFIITALLLKFQFIKRGLETYVVRLGVPIACIGLVDSDAGVFSPYLKIFIQNMATTLVQLVMLKVSFYLFLTFHVFWGIAAAVMTLNTPRFLSQYMLQVFNMPNIMSPISSGLTIHKNLKDGNSITGAVKKAL